MLNLYEGVRDDPRCNKFAIGEFLFAEYTCGIGEEKIGLWTHSDYLVHVVTGKKTWHTSDGIFSAVPGETLFFRKGAFIAEQHFEADFCLLMFFIPDDFVRSTAREIAASLSIPPTEIATVKAAARVENDVILSAFFESMRTYFVEKETPAEPLLLLKLKELIVGILTSGKNPALAAYFRQLGQDSLPSLVEIMEANFRFNLSLDEYARMCHRSLSSFKRDFKAAFQEPPGKWLLRKRLDYSAALLRTSKLNITEIAFESGFEDISHFSRVFKDQFKVSPLAFRQSVPRYE